MSRVERMVEGKLAEVNIIFPQIFRLKNSDNINMHKEDGALVFTQVGGKGKIVIDLDDIERLLKEVKNVVSNIENGE